MIQSLRSSANNRVAVKAELETTMAAVVIAGLFAAGAAVAAPSAGDVIVGPGGKDQANSDCVVGNIAQVMPT